MLNKIFGAKKGTASKSPDPKRPPAIRGSSDPLGEYEERKRKGQPITAALCAQVGNMYRDLGRRPQAAERYLEAAEMYVGDEAWSAAIQMVRQAERLLGRMTAPMHLLVLQAALGQAEPLDACRAIEALGQALAPSDGAQIERVVALVDREVGLDPEVEVALAEALSALARPDRALERLRAGLTRAKAMGRQSYADEIQSRIDQIAPRAQAQGPSAESKWPLPKPTDATATVPTAGAQAAPSIFTRAGAPAAAPVIEVSPAPGGAPEGAMAAPTSPESADQPVSPPIDLAPVPEGGLAAPTAASTVTPSVAPATDSFWDLPPLPSVPESGSPAAATGDLDALPPLAPITLRPAAELEAPAAVAPTAVAPPPDVAGPDASVARIRFAPVQDAAIEAVPEDRVVADPEPQTEPAETPYVDLTTLRPDAAPADTRFTGTDGLGDGVSETAQLQHLMEQLEAGIAASVPADEAETHYDLGITFLQMRQWDQAVKSFQAAYRAPAFRYRAAEGLAQAFLERGDALLAHRAVRVTLVEVAADDANVLGLLYWQGRAAEAMGRTGEAIDLYERVAVQDAAFLDARERLARLAT